MMETHGMHFSLEVLVRIYGNKVRTHPYAWQNKRMVTTSGADTLGEDDREPAV
jgi:hypothetical protein